MSFVWSALDAFHELLDTHGDPRMKGYPLMDTPWPTFALMVTYIFGVKYFGPKLMEKRKPFELKRVLIFYNLVEIVISIIALYEAYVVGWFTHYSWRCQPIDRSDTPLNRRLVRGVWLYYISKFIELFDTIFFVMRKKNDQVSKLHVYHHSIMPFNTWVTAKFLPGGHATFGGVLNSFVHVIMYTYYLLAALGPSMRKYLWWKKYLTVLQMGQFVFIFFHAMQPLFIDCDFPRPYAYFTLFQAGVFLILFKNFYDNAYEDGTQKVAVTATRTDDSEICSKEEKPHQENMATRKRKATSKVEASR
uniref:Elongation of very long chain fatty acids protein n=2 Tax=Lygus hesperus TaxID=30085 RepID=A0A146MGW9_LYGHE